MKNDKKNGQQNNRNGKFTQTDIRFELCENISVPRDHGSSWTRTADPDKQNRSTDQNLDNKIRNHNDL